MRVKDCLYVAAGAVMMGSLPVFVRNIHLNPVELTFFRLSAGFLFLFLFMLLLGRRPEVKDWKLITVITFVNTATIVLYIASIQLTKIATAALLLYMAPVYAVPLSRLVGERVDARSYMSLALGLAGLWFVLSPDRFSKGCLFGLFSGMCYAVYFLLMKKARLEMDALDVTFAYLAMSSLLLSPSVTLGLPPSNSWVWIVGLGFIPTALAFTIFNHGIKGCGAGKSSISALIEPVSAGVFGYVFFGEVLKPLQVAGGALILLAVALLLL